MRLGILVTLLALFSLGCSSTQRYVYTPRPLVVDVPAPDGSHMIARAVIAVVGVRKGSAKRGEPDEVMLRCSLENLSEEPIGFERDTWKLVAADLRPFGPVVLEPDTEDALLPGGERTVELYFALPPGSAIRTYDMSGLNLRFGIRYQFATVVSSATFERWVRTGYGPYGHYGYRYPYGSPYGSRVSFGASFSASG